MAFPKNEILNTFDVYPKVFVAHKETLVHIRSLGSDPVFQPDTEYRLCVCAMFDGNPVNFPATGDFRERVVRSDAEGNFAFPCTFDKEQQYLLRFFPMEDDKRIIQFPVYCVEEDLCGRWPLIGDLHVHTYLSDGDENPEVVCANYRSHGYDFMVISDHQRYYPSVRAVNFYKDVPTELHIVPGEEIHLPNVHGRRNDVHIVNFGGEYSVNALVDSTAVKEAGRDLSVRAVRTEDVPDIMSMDEFEEKMQSIIDATPTPENIDALPYAMCCWIFDHIRKGNGLGIFAHPNWISNVSQIPEVFTDYMMEKQPFDAFEVLGGESYYEQNGFQTVRYYEQLAKGNRFPIVGSTDSHCSYSTNPKAFIASTIVFSPKNEKNALIASIKDFYSVAVDTISKKFRLVGESRLVHYGTFLLKNYFPLHDELCFEEGRLMKQYATGTEDEKQEALSLLSVLHGRVQRHREKYFAF